jgi:hypothetical protein
MTTISAPWTLDNIVHKSNSVGRNNHVNVKSVSNQPGNQTSKTTGVFMYLWLSIMTFLILLIFIMTFKYLNDMESCQCFNENSKYASELEYMKYFQLLEIILFIVILGVSLQNQTDRSVCDFAVDFAGAYASIFVLLLLLGVHAYMTYSVIQFYSGVKKDCKCVNESWAKYFVYYEGLLSVLVSFRLVSTLFLTFFVFVLVSTKGTSKHLSSSLARMIRSSLC